MSQAAADGYNGPSKDEAMEVTADYEEQRYIIMRAMAKCGAILTAYEKRGGIKKDIQDLYDMRQMEPDEVRAELQRRFRVSGWVGVVDQEASGQSNFLRVFDAPADATLGGIGGAPIGSRLSIGRAKTAGFNDGKHPKGPSLQDGIDAYGWHPSSEEAMAYAEGWGEGFKIRPEPKERKKKDAEPEAEAPPEPMRALPAPDATEPQKKRGRPKLGKSNVDEMAERAAAMPLKPAKGKKETKAAEPVDDSLSAKTWDPDSEFNDQTVPSGPVH